MSQKLASTRKLGAPALALAAGLVVSVASIAVADTNQPRTNPPSGQPAAGGTAPTMAAPAASADVMFKVSAISIRYAGEMGSSAPTVAQLMNDVSVELRPVATGFTTVEGARGTSYTLTQLNAELAKGDKQLSQRALESVLTGVRDAINRRGIIGVTAGFDTADIEYRSGSWVDVRQGRTAMNLVVGVFNVDQVRTVGQGERLGENEAVNHGIHSRIRRNSPVKSGGVMNKTDMDNYVLRLNRRPGRNVDVAISASDKPGLANVDYIVRESKPWAVYAQISNTGTEATSDFRERFGFYHNQLTNEDDVLSIDYSTGNFTDSHSFQGSYERPIFNWDKLRFQIFGGFNRWDASEVGITEEEFSGDGMNVGFKVIWNFYQFREFFLDFYNGAKYAHYRTSNDTIDVDGRSGFFLPIFGLRAERHTDTMSTDLDIGFEFNMPAVGGTQDSFELDGLGRADADRNFMILSWDVTHSMYLEPLFDGKNFRDGKSTMAHEMYFSFRGQTSFGARLTPNFQGVAGGLYTVRGYEESERAGDDLLLFTAEYRLHIPQLFTPQDQPGTLFGHEFRWAPQSSMARADWDLIARGFVDLGWTGLADKLTFESDETFIGAGVGLELQMKRNFNVRVDLGFPLAETDRTDTGDPRLHFAATLLW